MERLGGVLLVDELNGSDIHRLENGLTLDSVKHSFFDTLMLWLEETVSVLFNVRNLQVIPSSGNAKPVHSLCR